MNPTERASHPSRAQVELLTEFLGRNPSLAKGFSKIPSARDASRKSWEAIAVKLNSLGGCDKSWKQWTKYGADKKSAVKKKAALRYRARNKTGGGLDTAVVELTQVEEKMLSLMGGETFSVGDRHLAINPFEVTSPSQASPALSAEITNINIPLDIDNATDQDMETMIPFTTSTLQVPQAEPQECLPGTSYMSARPSGVHLVNSGPQNVSRSPGGTPPRLAGAGLSHPPTPSGSGTCPARRRLNLSHLRSPHNTTSTSRIQQRGRRQSPPSQRRSQLMSLTEKFLNMEQQRLEMDRRHLQMMELLLSSQVERDRATVEAQNTTAGALSAIAESIKILAEALKK